MKSHFPLTWVLRNRAGGLDLGFGCLRPKVVIQSDPAQGPRPQAGRPAAGLYPPAHGLHLGMDLTKA